MTDAKPAAIRTPIRIWDAPIRLFHWLLAIGIVFAWWAAETHHMDWHKDAGSAVAGLLVFRVWYGVFGSSTAKFSDFVKGPKAVLAYLGGKSKATSPGHNPAGGWSVVLMLLTTIAVVAFGLFAVDTDGIESGPFSNLVDFDTGRLASKAHGLAFEGLEILIGLHLLAIAFYTVIKRKALIPAMVTGKRKPDGDEASLRPAGWISTLIALILGLATAAVLIKLSQ